MYRVNSGSGSQVQTLPAQTSETSGSVGTLRLRPDPVAPSNRAQSEPMGYPRQAPSLASSNGFQARLKNWNSAPAKVPGQSAPGKEISQGESAIATSHRPSSSTDSAKEPFDISLVNGDLSPEEALERAIANSMQELSTEQRIDVWKTPDEDEALALALQLSQEQLAREQATQQSTPKPVDNVGPQRTDELLPSGASRCSGPGLDKAGTRRAHDVMQAGAQEVEALMVSESMPGAWNPVSARNSRTSTDSTASSCNTIDSRPSMHLTGVEGEVLRLNESNGEIADWMNRQHIRIKHNGGGKDSNNCLLMSILQHVSGNYSSEHPEHATYYREKLDNMHPEAAGRTLDCTSDACKDLINMVNRDYPESKLSVSFYYAHESGKPYLHDRIGAGENHVAIWHTGGHYAALVHE